MTERFGNKTFERVSAQIDLDALKNNIDVIKELAPGTKLLPVIKANAYGHGSAVCGKTLEKDESVWGFAVATAEEGRELRRAGIKKPVMLLGGCFPDVYDIILKYDLRPAVFTMEQAEGFSKAAVSSGVNVKVHIAIDTGMSRIGFLPDDVSAGIIHRISRLDGITIEGMFTHFARADELDTTSAKRQQERFESFIARLKDEGLEIPICHEANSAAIFNMEGTALDMVRPGIIIYGLMPSDEMADVIAEKQIGFRPVMTLKSHVIYVKDLEPGMSVSYGGTYTADSKRRLATVPVGYADGYPRQLSNKAFVLIKGKRAPIRGRVCMDQFMVDVTDIEGVCVGDEVILIGTQGEETITAEELGDISGRFNYELVCDIERRVPRVYTADGHVTCQVDYLDL